MRWPGLMGGLFLLTWLITGCAGYKLGPTGGAVAGAKSIQVNPFQNQTMEPRLLESLTDALRKQLQQDGTYLLATGGDGDLVVNGVILSYERAGISYNPSDVITVQDYELKATVKLTARERGTGRMLADRLLTGRTTVRTGPDQTSSERMALSSLASDFARKAVSLLADGDW